MPQTLPGCLHPSNKNCMDWSSKGVLAYGSHSLLIIVDTFTGQRVQTIEHHAAAVNHVRWSPPSPLVDVGRSEEYRIASSDISGQILITDPISALKRTQFAYIGSTVLALEWFVWKDMSRDFILALHSSSVVILWNADSGDRIWTHSYATPLFGLSIDPFNAKHAVFSAPGTSLLIVSDLSLSTEPNASGDHLILCEDANKSTSIQNLTHHKAYRNTVFVVANSQMYCIDSDLSATLYRIQLEPNLISVLPCTSRDALFFVHSNGGVALRIGTYSTNDDRADAQFGLEKITSSDTLRHGAQQRVVAAVLCPVTQSTLAVLYGSGRIAIWQLVSDEHCALEYRSSFVEDYLSFDENLCTRPIGNLKIQQTQFVGSLSNGVSCVRMRPMDELGKVKDDSFADSALGNAHLAAVGSQTGILHLVDVFTSQIIKEFNVQSSPIKCLEWGGAYTILTAGYNHSLSASPVVRNDIFATDIRTGQSRRIRPEAEESHVTLLRVSFYHCYLALAFQREPLEIWDLKSLRLLRRMSKACPLIIDMSWSCKHHAIKTTEISGQSVYRENLVVLDSDNRLYHVVVKGLHVKDGKEVNTQWKSGGWNIRTMAWKDDILALGDADGRIAVWDLGRRQSRNVRASRMPVLRMTFSRLAGDHTLAVLHQRELTLWDTEAMVRTQQIVIDASRAALDMDLCGVSPILITNDNVFRYSPSGLKNMNMTEKEMPLLLNERKMTKLIEEYGKGSSEDEVVKRLIERKMARLIGIGDSIDTSVLYNEGLLRRFLGDLAVHLVLTVVQSRLRTEGNGVKQLPPDLQLFWDNQSFREREMRVACAACGATGVVERRLVERAVVAGGRAKDRAVDRLIGSADLRHASIKAALLVSSQDSEQARSLIKLIATNLIASDMIEDGVELLFLVGAGADACKYLQSQRQWNKSVVYAKMGLDDADDILNKWIAHLALDQKTQFVLAQASRAAWPETVQMLSSIGQSELARMILRTITSSPSAVSKSGSGDNSRKSTSATLMSPIPSPRLDDSTVTADGDQDSNGKDEV